MADAAASRQASPQGACGGPRGLGTFAGVFTPSILTILGIILFQRLGYVVGSGGLPRALAILGVATAVSVLTSLSLAAIATNMKVRAGGDYYLISRTLGIDFGGAIGLVLFLAQSVSVAFYCIGFGEAVASILDQPGDAILVAAIAASATLLVGSIAYAGADLATRFQFLVMAALAAALVSLYLGTISAASRPILQSSLRPVHVPGFWPVFAVFFPAVTGFTQGVSMSGDLRDPGRSIPRGTFWAIGVSTAIYLSAAVLLAASIPLDVLATDYGAMRRVAAFPWLIDAGVIAATLSSAMASCMGAPRILQSLARDNVIPPLRVFAEDPDPGRNPRRAVLLTTAVALATISLGNLNAVATVVGMCLLLSYGLLNFATFYEAKADSPAFRPRFRFFSAWSSLAGALLCLAAGIAISAVAAAVAGALLIALQQYLRRMAPRSTWADSRYAYHVRRVRDHLVEIRHGSTHPRDWRPHILAVCNEPADRTRLLVFASWIDGDSGFTTAVRILPRGHNESQDGLAAAEVALRHEVQEAGLGTFTRVIAAPDILDGFDMLTQAHGLGPLRANMILMSAHEQLGEPARMGDAPPTEALVGALRYGRNVILLQAGSRAWQRLESTAPQQRLIDVWWRDDATSRLSLLLAHLMTRTAAWRDTRIRVLAVAPAGRSGEAAGHVESLLEEVRINAVTEMVDFQGPQTLVDRSRDATVVFLPLRIRGNRLVGLKGQPLASALDRLPVTALVVAGEDIELDPDPENSTAAAQNAPNTARDPFPAPP